jgi:hypothetical protein
LLSNANKKNESKNDGLQRNGQRERMIPKKTEHLNIRIDQRMKEIIRAIEERHELTPTALVRGLLKGTAEFFDQNGFFYLPVTIMPKIAFETTGKSSISLRADNTAVNLKTRPSSARRKSS